MSVVNEKHGALRRWLGVGTVAGAVLGALGVGLWAWDQLAMPAGMSAMDDFSSWGAFIMLFIFMIGLGCGTILVGSFLALRDGERWGRFSRVAAWLGICSVAAGMILVVVDLGQPLRVFHLLTTPQFASPLMWDIVALPLVIVAGAVGLALSGGAPFDAPRVRGALVVQMATALLGLTVDAWIFGLYAAREAWNTALLAPWFVVSAIVSGLAVCLLLSMATRRLGVFDLGDGAICGLARALALFVVADLYCLISDVVTTGYMGGSGSGLVAQLVGGSLAPWFWTEVVAGVAAVALCLLGSSPKAAGVGAALALLSVFCKRFQFVASGFIAANVDLPGLVVPAQAEAVVVGSYLPTVFEWAMGLGVIGLGVLLFCVGVRVALSKGASVASSAESAAA